MSGWEKLTVAQLKDELKQRDIPLTGLKLKKDFIEKLEDLASTTNGDNNDTLQGHTDGAPREVSDQDGSDKQDAPQLDAHKEQLSPMNGITTAGLPAPDSTLTPEKTLPQDLPSAFAAEDSQAPAITETSAQPFTVTIEEVKDVETHGMLDPDPEQPQLPVQHENAPKQQANVAKDEEEESKLPKMEHQNETADEQTTPTPTETLSATPKPTRVSEQSPSPDRKRKRSSTDTDPRVKAQKLIKTENGQAATSQGTSPHAEEQSFKVKQDTSSLRVRTRYDGSEKESMQERQDAVEAARHPSTSTLYLCNFKRPINQQELKAHITAAAHGAAVPTSEAGPVKLFYMDKIRSHAFVAFQSVAHAARVRSAMHGKKFPSEPQRDPIWVDFIPDDKVEDFIDQESQSQSNFQSGGRGAGISSRFQVVYRDTETGVEAVLQDVNPMKQVNRPGISTGATNRQSYPQRNASYTTEPTSTSAIASTVHPDRAGFVPQSAANDQRRSPHGRGQEVERPVRRPHADHGSGFKELDDLFSSTQAKPRLYFKLPAQELIDDRLAMIRALIPAGGKSGEPGMKRYTFEQSDGQEEWVDNGPEFGRGWRGQDRLEGKAGGRGRGRRRGGGGSYEGRGLGRSGVDSYRGEGRAAPRDWDAPPR